jgi:hypothetical protein
MDFFCCVKFGVWGVRLVYVFVVMLISDGVGVGLIVMVDKKNVSFVSFCNITLHVSFDTSSSSPPCHSLPSPVDSDSVVSRVIPTDFASRQRTLAKPAQPTYPHQPPQQRRLLAHPNSFKQWNSTWKRRGWSHSNRPNSTLATDKRILIAAWGQSER